MKKKHVTLIFFHICGCFAEFLIHFSPFSHTFICVFIYTRTIPLKNNLPIPKFNNLNVSFLCDNIIYKLNKISFPDKSYHYLVTKDCKN